MPLQENLHLSLEIGNGTTLHLLRDAQHQMRITLTHIPIGDALTTQMAQVSATLTPAQAVMMMNHLTQIALAPIEKLQSVEKEEASLTGFR